MTLTIATGTQRGNHWQAARTIKHGCGAFAHNNVIL
jgi:hypothetical protein